jgi:hypothetical protein
VYVGDEADGGRMPRSSGSMVLGRHNTWRGGAVSGVVRGDDIQHTESFVVLFS